MPKKMKFWHHEFDSIAMGFACALPILCAVDVYFKDDIISYPVECVCGK